MKSLIKIHTFYFYFFTKIHTMVIWDPNHPYYDLNIHLGKLGKWFESFSFHTLKSDLKPHVSLRKIWTFFIKMCIFIRAKWNPNHPYYDLSIHLRELKKWFKLFSHLEIQFGTSCTFLKKICTFLRIIHTVFTKNTYIFIRKKQDPNHPYDDLNIHSRKLRMWFESFPHIDI